MLRSLTRASMARLNPEFAARNSTLALAVAIDAVELLREPALDLRGYWSETQVVKIVPDLHLHGDVELCCTLTSTTPGNGLACTAERRPFLCLETTSDICPTISAFCGREPYRPRAVIKHLLPDRQG
jgi:hypothetical protein